MQLYISITSFDSFIFLFMLYIMILFVNSGYIVLNNRKINI
jgi:hypothetical protein